MIRSLGLITLGALLLCACGSRVALAPKDGAQLPIKPAMMGKTPSADQLLVIDPQSRPERSDEKLRRSEQRQDDKFDLPPTG